MLADELLREPVKPPLPQGELALAGKVNFEQNSQNTEEHLGGIFSFAAAAAPPSAAAARTLALGKAA
jgi:hypothetical protein